MLAIVTDLRDVDPGSVAGELARHTPRTITNPRILREKVSEVRALGYAVEHEELTVGYMAVAVPIVFGERFGVGAVSICAPTFRADVPRFLQLLNAVRHQVEIQGALSGAGREPA